MLFGRPSSPLKLEVKHELPSSLTEDAVEKQTEKGAPDSLREFPQELKQHRYANAPSQFLDSIYQDMQQGGKNKTDIASTLPLLIEFYLKNNLDITIKNTNGFSFLFAAIWCADETLVKKIMNQFDLTDSLIGSQCGFTPLGFAKRRLMESDNEVLLELPYFSMLDDIGNWQQPRQSTYTDYSKTVDVLSLATRERHIKNLQQLIPNDMKASETQLETAEFVSLTGSHLGYRHDVHNDNSRFVMIRLSTLNTLTTIQNLLLFSSYKAQDHFEQSYLRVTYQDGRIHFYKFANVSQYRKIQLAMIDLGALIERSVSEIYPRILWACYPIGRIYCKPGVDAFEHYRKIHQKESLETMRFLQLNPDIKKARLIELGCGYGRAVRQVAKTCSKLLDAKNIECVGIDISKENIVIAKAEWQEMSNEIEGQFFELNSASVECRKILAEKKPGVEDIVICSGHLTANVLSMFDCISVFRNLYIAKINTILSGGAHQQAYTTYMVEQMGFDVVYNMDLLYRPCEIDFIQRSKKYKPLETFLRNSELGNLHYLNFSMCPDPVNIINEAENHPALKNVVCLDLSYCDLSVYKEKELKNFLLKFPNLRDVIYLYEKAYDLEKEASTPTPFTFKIKNVRFHRIHCPDERLVVLPFDMYPILSEYNGVKSWFTQTNNMKEVADEIIALRKKHFPLMKKCVLAEEKSAACSPRRP